VQRAIPSRGAFIVLCLVIRAVLNADDAADYFARGRGLSSTASTTRPCDFTGSFA